MGNGAQTWQFAYDGDGNRVKQIEPDGDITVYVGGLYEATYRNGAVIRTRKYYALGIQIVAMRDNDTLYFLHDDNLYSTSLVTNALGSIVSTNAYYPFGASRLSAGTRPTAFDFTGQRLDTTGLHFYNARYYDSLLGRFVSADTIVPGIGSQAYNRYAYTLNNPLKHIDPSGHQTIVAEGGVVLVVLVIAVPVLLVTSAVVTWHYYLSPDATRHQLELEKSLTSLVQSMMHTESTEEQPTQDPDESLESETDSKQTGVETTFGKKIEDQLEERGWTKDSVLDTIKDPAKTGTTRDQRHLPDGTQLDDPATAYANKDGSYVIRNDRTGDIVQVSNRNKPDWKDDSRIDWGK